MNAYDRFLKRQKRKPPITYSLYDTWEGYFKPITRGDLRVIKKFLHRSTVNQKETKEDAK